MKLINNTKGITLLEILLAMALLAIVIVPLGNFFINSFLFQSRSQRTVNANKVVEYVLEKFKNGQAIDLIDGSTHELTLKEFYEKISLTTNKNYNLTITSIKNSDEVINVGEQFLEVPEDFESILKLTNEGIKIEYAGDLGCSIEDNNTLIINSANDEADSNNIKIINEIGAYTQIVVKNITGKKVNIYKDDGITLNISDGSVAQANLNLAEQKNMMYDVYTVTVTAIELDDSSISSTVTTTIKKVD